MMATIAISLGVLFFLIALFAAKYPWLNSLIFCIGIIVANVPEGLLPQLTVALTLTAKKMRLVNVLVKNLETIETLGSTTCIASDKTGTLTQNRMTVSHIYYSATINNTGINVVSGNQYSLYNKDEPSFRRLQRVATLCNRAVFVFSTDDERAAAETASTRVPGDGGQGQGDALSDLQYAELVLKWKTLGDASESALIKFVHPIRDILEFRDANNKIVEIPFNSTNKWQLSIHEREVFCFGVRVLT